MRIVAITGRNSLEFRMQAVDCCFDQFLCKPIALAPLLDALHMTDRDRTNRWTREHRAVIATRCYR
jgi:DNA-binding response OmpR family regulator